MFASFILTAMIITKKKKKLKSELIIIYPTKNWGGGGGAKTPSFLHPSLIKLIAIQFIPLSLSI